MERLEERAVPAVILGTNINALGFNDTTCFCDPPDTNAAVGPNHVVEGVNTALGMYDKSGNLLSKQEFSTFFASLNPAIQSDPFIVYDDIAQRWYVTILDFNSFNFSDLLFAVSNDSDPTHGFSEMHRIHIGDTDFLDFEKVGFNADSVVISANDFASTDVPMKVVAIDKSSILDQDNSVLPQPE